MSRTPCFWLKAPFRLSVKLLLLLPLAACGDSGAGPDPDPVVSISVTPTTASLGAAEALSLTATLTNASNLGVTWATTGGTIAGTGATVTWTAPVQGGSYSVTVTSVEDATKSAAVSITVTSVSVSLSPTSAVLFRGEPASFTASVSGTTASSDLTWAATCGDLVPSGGTASYTAPLSSGSCEVSVTSVLDPSKSGAAQIMVRRASVVSATDDADDGVCSWEHCSLREAISAANTQEGADTVFLSPEAFSPSSGISRSGRNPAGRSSLNLGSSLPTITGSVTVIGEGADKTDIDMGASPEDQRRAFDISGESGVVVVRLQGLTIRNAVATGGPAIFVRDGARLETSDVALLDNTAVEAEGGAIVVVGAGTTAVLENTVIDGNRTADPGWPGGGLSVVAGGSLQMLGGRISNNQTSAWGAGIRGHDIGAITLENTLIEGNEVLDGGFGGGAFYIENPGGSTGVVTFTNITVRNNTSVGAGGGGGMVLRTNLDATITSSTITGNTASEGGGISFGDGSLTVEETTVDGNEGTLRGGGVFAWGSAEVSVLGGTVNENTAGAQGGGGFFLQNSANLTLDGTVIQGNMATGGSAGGGFAVFNTSVLDATDVEVRDNSGAGGGALLIVGQEGSSVSFNNSIIDGNQAAFGGGGIFAQGSGTLSLINSTVSNNVAAGASGGGVFTMEQISLDGTLTRFTGNSAAGAGGGLWLRGVESKLDQITASGNTAGTNGGGISAGGETTLTNSTIASNTAGQWGGGVLAVPTGSSPMRVENSTVSGNSAVSGGGLAAVGNINAVHVTLAGNTGTTDGPGLWVSTVGVDVVAALTNTLLSGNMAPGGSLNCLIDVAPGGSIASGGGNLSDDDSCSALALASDQNETSAGLDVELKDNGGPTATHALLTGSAAIDAGVATALSTDQRGVTRNSTPDTGAVEAGGQP